MKQGGTVFIWPPCMRLAYGYHKTCWSGSFFMYRRVNLKRSILCLCFDTLYHIVSTVSRVCQFINLGIYYATYTNANASRHPIQLDQRSRCKPCCKPVFSPDCNIDDALVTFLAGDLSSFLSSTEDNDGAMLVTESL